MEGNCQVLAWNPWLCHKNILYGRMQILENILFHCTHHIMFVLVFQKYYSCDNKPHCLCNVVFSLLHIQCNVICYFIRILIRRVLYRYVFVEKRMIHNVRETRLILTCFITFNFHSLVTFHYVVTYVSNWHIRTCKLDTWEVQTR